MKKGFALSTQEVFNVLAIIGLIIVVVYIFKGSYFDMTVFVEGSEDMRRMIALGNILLSSPELVVVEDGRNIRGVIDASKLTNLNRNVFYQEILYPGTVYGFEIKDIVDGTTVGSITVDNVQADVMYEKNFPLAIKYSENKIKPGVLELKYYVVKTTTTIS
jgi:hypothetical protein